MADVPDLDAFATGATTGNKCLTVIVHIEGVAANLNSVNIMGDLSVAEIPQLDVAVPAARVELVRIEGRELG